MHNSFEKQDRIHQDAMFSALFGFNSSAQTTMPFNGKDIGLLDLRKGA